MCPDGHGPAPSRSDNAIPGSAAARAATLAAHLRPDRHTNPLSDRAAAAAAPAAYVLAVLKGREEERAYPANGTTERARSPLLLPLLPLLLHHLRRIPLLDP